MFGRSDSLGPQDFDSLGLPPGADRDDARLVNAPFVAESKAIGGRG